MQTLEEKLDLNTMAHIISHLAIDSKDKEILLLLLQDRSRNFIRINHNLECFNTICRYLQLLRPLAIPSDKLVRVGGAGDGGYVMVDALSAGGGG